MENRIVLNQALNQTFQNLSKASKYLLILFAVSIIFGCNQTQSGDFIKLDAPLKEVLPKITLVVPNRTDINGETLEITVGKKFSGKGEYSIGNGETHGFQYTFYKQHVVESNRYVFAVVSYRWGGSGRFYYLTAIDKTTLKGDKEFLLGDRVGINNLASKRLPVTSDIVSISYMIRESGTSMSEKPDKTVEQDFTIHQGKLMTIKFVEEK